MIDSGVRNLGNHTPLPCRLFWELRLVHLRGVWTQSPAVILLWRSLANPPVPGSTTACLTNGPKQPEGGSLAPGIHKRGGSRDPRVFSVPVSSTFTVRWATVPIWITCMALSLSVSFSSSQSRLVSPGSVPLTSVWLSLPCGSNHTFDSAGSNSRVSFRPGYTEVFVETLSLLPLT